MQIINIYTIVVVILTKQLFIFGSHNNGTAQTIKSIFTDTDLGITVKIDGKGLIDCSGLMCSNQTEYCRIIELPVYNEKILEIRKQCVDKEGKN